MFTAAGSAPTHSVVACACAIATHLSGLSLPCSGAGLRGPLACPPAHASAGWFLSLRGGAGGAGRGVAGDAGVRARALRGPGARARARREGCVCEGRGGVSFWRVGRARGWRCSWRGSGCGVSGRLLPVFCCGTGLLGFGRDFAGRVRGKRWGDHGEACVDWGS